MLPPHLSLLLANAYSYHDFSEIGLPCVFPFHANCYHDILRRCLRQESPERIKKAVLFDVFENLNGDPYVRLQLNYGEPEPLAEQVWHHPQGQEVRCLVELTTREGITNAYWD